MKTLPLTKQQERMYLEWEINPLSCAYNTVFQFELNGKLEKKALHEALKYLTKKHEVLRTHIIVGEEIVSPHLEYYENKTDYQSIMSSFLYKPFNIKKERLFRYILIKLENNKHVLGLCWHHIIVDAASVNILLKDLSFAYNQYLNNKEISFSQDAVSLKRTAKTKRTESKLHKDYWDKKLLGQEFNTFLPEDVRKNKHPNDYRVYCELAEDLTQSLMTLVGSLETTLFTVLTSLFVIFIHKQIQSKNISLLYSVNIRNKLLREKVGFFVNNLPLCCKVDPSISFQCFVNNLTNQLNADKLSKDMTLSEIIGDVRKKQHISTGVLFNLLISQSTSIDFNINFANIDAKIIPFAEFETIPNIDLSLRFDYGKKILLEFECSKKFSKEYITGLIDSFVQLIKEVVRDPKKTIQSFPIITKKELVQLEKWNNTKREYPKGKFVHDLFEETAENNKDKIAVVYENQQLTYEVLNQRANQLAHYLKKNQVAPEVLVGISVPRGLESVIGLLGILKSGGIYAPIDPTCPKDRLEYMLENAGIKTLLTTIELKKQFGEYKGKIICIDQKEHLKEPITNLHTKILSNNLAYIIYTSGSTGRPKGVGIKQEALLNRVQWMLEHYFANSEEPVLLQRTIYSFDASVWEHFVPIIARGKLVVASDIILKDISKIGDLIKINTINTIQLVASIAKILVDDDKLNNSSLKRVFLGGEALSRQLAKRLSSSGKVILVTNLYGPTEAAIDVTHHACEKDEKLENIPIGTPIYNTQIHILDEYLNPIPIGNTGELYLGGMGLARGYINNPSLTAEKFIPNPFDNGARLYKTGDLGRYLPDGNIEFLGRTDHQVKIRGFRIELGEIESTIQSIPGIKQCIVLAREDIENQKRLVGYIILEKDKEGSALIKKCRDVCKFKLPDYMQPSQIIVLDKLPLTPSGKIDRKALPAPEGREGLDEYEEPAGLIEEQLADIWKEVLGIEKVGVTDSFFSVGGNSILLIQMLNKLIKLGYIHTTAIDLFNHHTIRLLALRLIQGRESSLYGQPEVDNNYQKKLKKSILLRDRRV